MKNNKILFHLVVFLMISLCNAQTKPIGDAVLDLKNFHFDTEISDLYPAKNKSKDFEAYYEIKGTYHNQMVVRDTTFTNTYGKDKKAIGMEYRQQSTSSVDTMAVFGNCIFQKVNIATTLEGKIKLINAVADELSLQQRNGLVNLLVDKYGVPKKLKCSWKEDLTLYEWVAKDRIIRFVTAWDEETTTIKLVLDSEKQSISPGEKESHHVGYLFIINSALKSEVFWKMKTGDFVFLDDSGL